MKVPFEKAEIHTFERFSAYGDERDFKGAAWVAFFYPYKNYPLFFEGDDMEEVIRKAEKFRKDEMRKAAEREKRLSEAPIKMRSARGKTVVK